MLNTKIIQALEKNLSCNLARLKCLSLLISAVLRHRTANLTLLATTSDGKSCSNESRYRRFQDFVLNFSLCLSSVSRFILRRIPKPSTGFVLAMDRTNWQFGRKEINFLAIAIIAGKVSIPIIWKVLPAKDIKVLTMDREFVGKEWLSWLDNKGVSYVVRIKKNTLVGSFSALELATRRGRKSQRLQTVFGLELFFACKPMKKDERTSHLLIISNRFTGKEALNLYSLRWGIERLFGHLKKKGFDLEATHMTNPAKLEKLFGILTMAFLLSFAWGCHLRSSEQKTSAATKRKSLFRLGLEDILNLADCHSKDSGHRSRLKEFLHWLSSTTFNSIFLV